KEDRWINAVDFLPGNASVVHCATVYMLTPESGQQSGSEMLQARTNAPLSVPGDGSSTGKPRAIVLATWIPGQKTVAFESGIGQLIPAGSELAVRLHYRGSGQPAIDLST